MLIIRLQRVGRRHQPSYRVVVAERRSKLGGPPVEDLGAYNSFTKALAVKKERVLYWLGIGAQPTSTVHNLFVKHALVQGKKISIQVKRKEGGAETPETQQENAETGTSPETANVS